MGEYVERGGIKTLVQCLPASTWPLVISNQIGSRSQIFKLGIYRIAESRAAMVVNMVAEGFLRSW